MPVKNTAPAHDVAVFPSGVVYPSTFVSGATAAYTVTQNDRYVWVDATSQAVTVTIPLAASVPAGFTVGVKKTDVSGNAVTVSRSGADTFDGATSVALAAQFNSCSLVSDGTSVWALGSRGAGNTAVLNGGF